MMYVCYANTDLLDKYGIANPQLLVESGDWTYDKFFELCQGVYEDDGDGIKNCESESGDTFGYITSGIHVDPWFYGSGATICERNADGEIVKSESFGGERVANTIDRLCDFLDGEFGIYTAKVTHQKAFGQGRSLFMMDRARVSHKVIATSYGDTKFVILPCPKYDKDQEKYITVMGNPFTLYGIAADVANPKMASAFIECFASEGYRVVTPAVFEISLKTRYVADSLSGQMYDLIRANITYDVGRIFSSDLIGQSTFRNAVSGHQNWGSVAKQASKSLSRQLKTLNNKLGK
jgi:ABC-type glycerol-3-phosphate transport system substrate-binding protein